MLYSRVPPTAWPDRSLGTNCRLQKLHPPIEVLFMQGFLAEREGHHRCRLRKCARRGALGWRRHACRYKLALRRRHPRQKAVLRAAACNSERPQTGSLPQASRCRQAWGAADRAAQEWPGSLPEGASPLQDRHTQATNASAARAMPQMHSGLRCRRSMWYTRASCGHTSPLQSWAQPASCTGTLRRRCPSTAATWQSQKGKPKVHALEGDLHSTVRRITPQGIEGSERHRLYHGRDRCANRILHVIAIHSMKIDPRTIVYAQKKAQRRALRQGDTPLPEALHSAQGITAPSHTRSILKEAGMAGEAW
jgi:hypothetical protein